MSVLIKGMDMPENCAECVISVLGKCRVSGKEIVLWQTNRKGDRPPHCPLVPVPPHGRLIDGDIAEVISFEEADAEGKDFADGVLYAADFISQLPTIIPAEEEKT